LCDRPSKKQTDRISSTPTKSDRPFQQNKPDRPPPNKPQRDRLSPASRKAIAFSVVNISVIASIACYRAALALTH
jgi:hypothetical protein